MKVGLKKFAVALSLIALFAVFVIAFVELKSSRPEHHPSAVLQPAQTGQPAPTRPEQAPVDCHLPGPAPAMPDGHTASADAIRQGHDNIQAFVLQLEAYQACRNNQIDHAAAGVSVAQKQTWLDEGNDAVDQANALAQAFAAQLRVFKSRTKTR